MVDLSRGLDLDPALMGQPDSGRTFWPLFNFLMIPAYYLGFGLSLAHAFSITHRGWGWAVLKGVAIVALYMIMPYLM